MGGDLKIEEIFETRKMKLINFILGGALAQDYDYTFYDGKDDAGADAYQPYYSLDQNIEDFNLDSAQAGFGAETDIEENMKSKPIGAIKSTRPDNRYPPSSSNRNGGYPQPNLEQTATGLKCWHCEADSYELCSATGYEEQCHANEERCELVIRQRQGYITQIHMGCKQLQSCENNKRQNFQNANPNYTQCRPEAGHTHSVCRQCCDEDNCTRSPIWWYPASRAEWAA